MVTLSPTAAEKLKKLMVEKDREDAALRLYITSGGCRGFNYGMAFDRDVRDDDQVFEQEGVRVVVDPMSGDHVDGAEIDYVDSLMGGGFTVQNPNATSTCGCGQSFRTQDDRGEAKSCNC